MFVRAVQTQCLNGRLTGHVFFNSPQTISHENNDPCVGSVIRDKSIHFHFQFNQTWHYR